MRWVLLFSLYRWGKRGTERLNNWPKIAADSGPGWGPRQPGSRFPGEDHRAILPPWPKGQWNRPEVVSLERPAHEGGPWLVPGNLEFEEGSPHFLVRATSYPKIVRAGMVYAPHLLVFRESREFGGYAQQRVPWQLAPSKNPGHKCPGVSLVDGVSHTLPLLGN